MSPPNGLKQKRRLRQEKAKERSKIKKTPKEQLQILDQRLGVGHGANKERNRLFKKIYSK